MNEDANIVSQFEPNYLADVTIPELCAKTGVTCHDVSSSSNRFKAFKSYSNNIDFVTGPYP